MISTGRNNAKANIAQKPGTAMSQQVYIKIEDNNKKVKVTKNVSMKALN